MSVSILQDAPVRPCLGSGYCCRKVPCVLGVELYGPQAPCPGLVFVDGRYRCGPVLAAEGAEREALERDLAIGAGCCSPLNSDRQRLVVAIGKGATT